MLLATYGGRDGGIVRACSDGRTSEHKEGRAFDWMLDSSKPAEKAAADAFLAWLLAPGPDGTVALNARRLGVMYVIWNDRIWGGYRASEGWRAYTGASEHRDHIHLSLSWEGATGRTSWWTGSVASRDYGPCVLVKGQLAPPYTAPNPRPCPQPGTRPTPTPAPAPAPAPSPAPSPSPAPVTSTRPTLVLGSRGDAVRDVQRRLRVSPVTGVFGSSTRAAVVGFQKRQHLGADGVVGPLTWRLVDMQLSARPVARYGARGDAVRDVQRRLAVSPRSGWFGPTTRTAVRAFQSRRHLVVDGVVGPKTWRLLDR